MVKGKRLHDMMCSISDTYLSLYIEKSLSNKLEGLLRCKGVTFYYNQEGYSLLKNTIHQHLTEKGFI